jgi:hypothetical protein
MKRLLILLISLLSLQFAFPKDYIIKKNGSQIECTVQKQDSINTTYTSITNGMEINGTINNSEIKEILYNKQSDSDTIVIEKNGLDNKYFHNNKSLTYNELQDLLRSNKRAYKLSQQAKSIESITYILGFAGGYCLGYGLFTNIALSGVGVGIILVTLPIAVSASSTLKKAVLIRNMDFKASAPIPETLPKTN